MPTMRSNLLRLQISSFCYQYELEVISNQVIEEEYLQEIEQCIYELDPFIVYSYPYIYAVKELAVQHFEFMLSNGVALNCSISRKGNPIDSANILHLIAVKMMKITKLMYCKENSSCFNPFQLLKAQSQEIIPGFSLEMSSNVNVLGLYIIPMNLSIPLNSDFAQNSKILLDMDTGSFYLKENIVRIDKIKKEVSFRSGATCKRDGLRSVTIKNVNGYDLVDRLFTIYHRLKQQCKQFLSLWQLKFDNKFLQLNYKPILPGSLTFRGNQQKSMADLVTAMSPHNYYHQYRSFFSNVSFDDNFKGSPYELIMIVPEGYKEFGMGIKNSIESIKTRMEINLNVSTIIVRALSREQDIFAILNIQKPLVLKCFVFIHCRSEDKLQRDSLEKIIQFMINQGTNFHLIEAQRKDAIYEAISLRNLAIIYTKSILNPWRIRNAPFMTTPLVAMTINVQPTRSKQLSIAIVSTMNVYLTKFTSSHRIASQMNLQDEIALGIKECLDKFRSVHNKYPNRVFIFRNGHRSQASQSQEQYKNIKYSIYSHTNVSMATYITLTKQHSLRTYNQIDANMISFDTIKKIQLLLYIEFQSEIYIQLEMEQPMHKIRIYQVESQDPNFVTKVMELMARLVYGGVGNIYGEGLGFINYAEKFNVYREYNLENWKVSKLKEGYLLFL